jgi:hypothetical protein
MFFLFLLPVVFFLLLFGILYTRNEQAGYFTKIRIVFLQTSLYSSLLLILITEILSSFKMVNRKGLVLAWLICLIALLLFKRPSLDKVKELFRFWKSLKREPVFYVLVFVLGISLAIGLLYPPNNFDSMTYHMGRVAHWQQNQSVSYYQTHIMRQLDSQPLAEYIILHLQVLSGGDRLANTVQLFFFFGAILLISLLAKELGANTGQQKLISLFTCLIPMAIIQSNSTMNDIVAGYFLICFAYFTILLTRKTDRFYIVLAGISLGLAWFTKGTAYIFTLPFCLWYALILLKQYRMPLKTILRSAGLLLLIPLIAILINSGFYYRNIFLTGSPLGTSGNITTNKAAEPKQLLFVGVKNILNHLPISHGFKNKLTNASRELDIDINDEKYNFTPISGMVEGFSYHEDYAQNFIHTIAIILFSFLFIFRRSLYREKVSYYTFFVFTLWAISILYCCLLKWQPWSNRLETGLFMLYCVFLGIEIDRANKWLKLAAILSMAYFGFAALGWNSKRPLLPVAHSIFKKPYDSFIYKKGLAGCKEYLDQKGYRNIGIFIDLDSWDYPYYKLLTHSNNGTRVLKHVLVQNESAIYLDDFKPDVIISCDKHAKSCVYLGKTYTKTKIFEDSTSVLEVQ